MRSKYGHIDPFFRPRALLEPRATILPAHIYACETCHTHRTWERALAEGDQSANLYCTKCDRARRHRLVKGGG